MRIKLSASASDDREYENAAKLRVCVGGVGLLPALYLFNNPIRFISVRKFGGSKCKSQCTNNYGSLNSRAKQFQAGIEGCPLNIPKINLEIDIFAWEHYLSAYFI